MSNEGNGFWRVLALSGFALLVLAATGCSGGELEENAGTNADDAAQDGCEPESDEEFCSRRDAECGELTADDNCGSERTVDCGECPEGVECGAQQANRCHCPCEVDGTCYAQGESPADAACSICDPDQSGDSLVDRPDGTECDDGDECTASSGSCQDGQCVATPFCEGTDTECGCTECTDCTAMDEWVDVGEPYDCCDDGRSCTCRDQVLREYGCDGTECTYEETDERTLTMDCFDCGYSQCTDGSCECPDECCIDDDCGTDQQCCGGSCTDDSGDQCEYGGCLSHDDCGPHGQCCTESYRCISTEVECGDYECSGDDDCGDGEICCVGDCLPDSKKCPDDDCSSNDDCVGSAQCCNDACVPGTQICFQ